MLETAIALMMGHVLADFIFQPTKWVETKRHPLTLIKHGVAVGILTTLALGHLSLWVLALSVVHVLIDTLKVYALKDTLTSFLVDQLAHIITIIAVVIYAPNLWALGYWADWPFITPMLYFIAAIIATRVGGFAIGYLMAPYQNVTLPKGLDNGGTTIGLLERGLIFIFVLAGQPTAIGFLIAAKSILRFDASKDHSASEYIIIGTLASFGWAILTAYATLEVAARIP